jgi:hypothetical protein
MFVATTADEAVEHLVTNWSSVDKGALYPGLDDDSADSAMSRYDVYLMKMRYRVDGRKYGALVAVDEDLQTDPTDIATRVAQLVGAEDGHTFEWNITRLNPAGWNPIPAPDTNIRVLSDDTHQFDN